MVASLDLANKKNADQIARSAPLLFANPEDRFSQVELHILNMSSIN